MEVNIRFKAGNVKEELLNQIAEKAFETIKHELPEEIRTFEICRYVINLMIDVIDNQKIC